MKPFTYSHFILVIGITLPKLYRSQLTSSCTLSPSSSSAASTFTTQAITYSTRPLTGRQLYELGIQYQFKLPCKHYLNQSDLAQIRQGRAEGELPVCPVCKKSFIRDQISSSLV